MFALASQFVHEVTCDCHDCNMVKLKVGIAIGLGMAGCLYGMVYILYKMTDFS